MQEHALTNTLSDEHSSEKDEKMPLETEFCDQVTIGLCVKNCEKTIRACAESILNQTYPKHLMEIIVVDGKSRDRTMNILTELISKSNIVASYFSDEGQGIATARQIVLDKTKSEYIVFVDGDVLISTDFVSSQVSFMQNNSGIAMATGIFYYQKGIQKALPAVLQSLSKYVGAIEWGRSKKHRGFPPNDASVYLVKASREVGGFDKTIKGASEDEDIIIKFNRKGWSIALNERAKFYALSRETWQALWLEYAWFGYGYHFLSHKYPGRHFFVRHLPLIYLYVGLKSSLFCYKLTLEKKSFLLPLLLFFCASSQYFGFLKAHQEEYGHKNNQNN